MSLGTVDTYVVRWRKNNGIKQQNLKNLRSLREHIYFTVYEQSPIGHAIQFLV